MNDVTGAARLTGGQRAALGGAVVLALTLATYGAIGSYRTISDKAAEVGVPYPQLVPIGIDGGLVGVVVLDLVLAWNGNPIGWLRQLARLLTAGTVAANVSAGWPNPIAVGLHAAAPLMLLVMVEAGRTVLLRRVGLAAGVARDKIPCGRWVLSPWRTWLLWRRMVLWQITDYRIALQTEARIRRAQTLLRVQFGRRWKHKAPADLVWMLGTPPFADDACRQVDTLVGHHHTITAQDAPSSWSQDLQPHEPPVTSETVVAPEMVSDQLDGQLQEVVRINERHWAQRNRPISAETVRKHLHISAARARHLTSTVRALDKATIERGATGSP
jgi:uncharacterized protein DUF2637